MMTSIEYFDTANYDFSAQKKVDNFLTPYIPCVEATAIKRKDNTWDVFFNQFEDKIEFDYLTGGNNHYFDPVNGFYLFNTSEEMVEEKFRDWAENVLMKFRRNRID